MITEKEYDKLNCRIDPNGEIYYCEIGQTHEQLAEILTIEKYNQAHNEEFLLNNLRIKRSTRNLKLCLSSTPITSLHGYTQKQQESIKSLQCFQKLSLDSQNEIISLFKTQQPSNYLNNIQPAPHTDPINLSRFRLFGPGNYS